jgi:hypothetical protein
VSNNFATINVVDFEYEADDGDLPNVLCMVVHVLNENLQHVRTIKMWRGEFGTTPPFDIGPDALFVAYSAWAELTCFMVLGWKFPEHIFDLHTNYLAVSNVLLPHNPDETRTRQPKDLGAACRAYGLEGWRGINKKQIAEDIGHGLWSKYGREAVIDYCGEDVRMEALLLVEQLHGRRHLPAVNVEHILHWSNYSAKNIAQIQTKGMPIDMSLSNAVQENKAAVVGALLKKFDPSYGSDNPIYSPDGSTSYEQMERGLAGLGVTAWPRLESGRLDLEGDAFRLMYHVPGIERLHALKDSLGVIVRAKLPIGRDGRNRPSLFPFGTATGRNAHARSLYNAHAAMRSFMLFPAGAVYLDWRAQEVGVSAAISGDQALMAAYRGGDIYHALALLCGLTSDTDAKRWKKNNIDVRQRMKTLQLAINYGMGVPSLAKGLNRHPLIASAIIERHRQTYPRFWQWREDMVQSAMLERCVETVFGWPLRISNSPNKRTLYNFPMQANGAEMLRLATMRLCEVGLVPSMLVHDGILIEVNDEEQIAHAKLIMRNAARKVCNGFEVGVDVDQQLAPGAHYRDRRPVAKAMWETIMSALQEVGAMPKAVA